ncbi:unnamed protein product [Cunninghamella echinulata]
MGYCNRCGDIINGSKCRKCGGKPVESLAKGNTDSKSIVDRWQSQYANSILSGPDPAGTTSTPLMKRNSVANFPSSYRNRSPSISVQPKTCILCHKAVPLGSQLGKVDYCHECRGKIFDKKSDDKAPVDNTVSKQCVICFESIKPEQPKVQHQGRAWHKDCIRCYVCSKVLLNPTALDLQGASRCLDCQKQQNGGTTSIISPTSTVSSRLSSESRFSPIPRSKRRESFGSLTSQSTLGDFGTYNSLMADKLSTRKKSMDAISSYSRPQLDSKLFRQYQKSIHQQKQQQPASPLTPTEKQRPITPTSPDSNKFRSFSPTLSTGLNDMNINNISLSTSTSTLVSNIKNRRSSVSNSNTATADKPTSKKTCRKCMQQLRGPRVRLPTPSGDTWYYHYDCLTCAACGGHFTESEFVGDGKDVFHLHCRAPSPPRSTSPPSPIATLSTSTSNSPIPSVTKSTPHLNIQANKKHNPHGAEINTNQQITDYRCHTCQLIIEDKYLKNGTRLFHPKCFTCSSCHEQIPSDKPFYDIQQEAHCESCTQKIMKTNPSKSTGYINPSHNNNKFKSNNVSIDVKSIPNNKEFPLTLSPSVSSPLIPWDEQKGDTPSHIWMNRTKALPKLGGSKICPGCNLSIAVMDDTPGPKASRWHKKCLKCTGCRKQMDSGAKVIMSDKKWLVKCSDCSDKKPIPKYVR